MVFSVSYRMEVIGQVINRRLNFLRPIGNDIHGIGSQLFRHLNTAAEKTSRDF